MLFYELKYMRFYIAVFAFFHCSLGTTFQTIAMQERIRQIMDHYGLSQQNFAAQLGVAPATISSIFTGRTNPTNKHVQAIHKAFPEIDTNWLMFGEGEMLLSLDGKTEGTVEDVEGNAKSATLLPETTLFGEEMPGASVGVAAGNAGMHASMMGGNARGIRREGSVLAQQYGGMLEAANLMDKKIRKIKEIRVFYDDGTFEVFSPSSK